MRVYVWVWVCSMNAVLQIPLKGLLTLLWVRVQSSFPLLRAIPGPLCYDFLETYNMYFRIASNRQVNQVWLWSSFLPLPSRWWDYRYELPHLVYVMPVVPLTRIFHGSKQLTHPFPPFLPFLLYLVWILNSCERLWGLTPANGEKTQSPN